MHYPITLKGVVSSKHLDPNGAIIVQVTAPFSIGQAPTVAVGEAYKFEPYCNISLRAADLGDPSVGATVEVRVALS